MVSEKLRILVGKVGKRIGEIKPEDLAKFALKEAAGSIPVVGLYIKDAIDEFSPYEKLELLVELKEISQNQFTELSKELGVSVEYLKDIKTFTYDACAIQKADHEEIKGLLLRLMKNQAKFEIGYQTGEYIINLAGDIVINNPITGESSNIPCIQSVLRKGEMSEGDFFKSRSEWVDFEKGFIVERKEVDDIIKKIENEKVQLVQGAPASGKSIILKNVGYRLANENKNVYMVELKKHLKGEVELFFDNIPKINDKKPIFMVDDAHLNLDDCERLVRVFKSKGDGKLIIGSRETREFLKKLPKEGALYESLNELSKTCIHVQAEDVTERMIGTFLEKQYHFNEDKINIVSSNLDKYKNDLWLLSWALKAYNKDKESVEVDEIYDNIADSIRNIQVGKERELINAEDVFLPLSVFYRFEIPTERYFLEEHMDIDGNIINQLIGIQEIAETKETKMLSLNHSSIAGLYFSAYLRKSYFGIKIKKNILNGKDEKHFEYCLFYRYLTNSDPRNTIDVVISLHRNFSDEKDGYTLLRRLVEQDEIQESIETGINKEDDLENIGECIKSIGEVDIDLAFKLANNIEIETLSSKIKMERNIEKIGKFIKSFIIVNKDVAEKLVKSISERIENEEDLIKIGKLVSDIAWISEKMAMRLTNSVSLKIENAEDLIKVRRCLSNIANANQLVGMKLIDNVLSRIEKEEDIDTIRKFLVEIANVSKYVGSNLANRIDIPSEKIEKEEDIEKIGRGVSDIARINEEGGRNLANRIDINILSAKIKKEEDIEKIGNCIRFIAFANKDVGLELANLIDISTLSLKIENEEDVGKIGRLISAIELANKNQGLRLADNININVLLLNLEKEEDIGKVERCVSDIYRANRKVGLNLLIGVVISRMQKVNDLEKLGKLILDITGADKESGWRLVESVLSILEKENNIKKWGRFLSEITGADYEVKLKLVNSVSSKLYEEKDIEKIVGYIFIIERTGILSDDMEMTLKLIDINAFSKKIEDEGDVGKIGECVSLITDVSKELAWKLVNRINISSLSEKIYKEVDEIKKERCLSYIKIANLTQGLYLSKSVAILDEIQKNRI